MHISNSIETLLSFQVLLWELKGFRCEIKFGNSVLKFKLKENATKRDLEIETNLALIFRMDWEEKE